MKLPASFIRIFLAVIFILLLFKPVYAQRGNQSDLGGNDIQEIVVPDDAATGNSEGSTSTSSTIIDRDAVDNSLSAASPEQAVEQFEEVQVVEFAQQLGLDFFGDVASVQETSRALGEISQITGNPTGIIYVASLKNNLQLLFIPPNSQSQPANKSIPESKSENSQKNQVIRKIVPEANRENIQKIVQDFRYKITNPRRSKSYLNEAQKLYNLIIKPLEIELKNNQIKTLVFSMDSGLRSMPIAALHDGKQFLIEKYGVALIPSFSLTDTSYLPLKNTKILAIGISESTQGQTPLPAVGVEVSTLANKLWQGQAFLNEKSTIGTLKDLNKKQHFGIIHIATHAEFQTGELSNSYIQFWNERFTLDQLKTLSKELRWDANPKVEMLVLSACKTAVGSNQAELGFAGLAIQSGVKTALGSLWYVSDEGSLGLMSKFYEQLNSIPFKSQALRQAQLAMLKGEVRLEDGKLRLGENNYINLPPELAKLRNVDLSHPYFWSAFTMIGNWN